eukprot:5180_1
MMWLFEQSKTRKLMKFYDDKEKLTTQFKALYSYLNDASFQERTKFHSRNYRRVFSTCRNALDEYSTRAAYYKSKRHEDITKPLQIIEALTKLCQDVPYLLKQGWNCNSLSQIFTQLLTFNINNELRYKCIQFVFTVMNTFADNTLDTSSTTTLNKYTDIFKCVVDYTPFCICAPYEQYYNNFKSTLIVAQKQLSWVRIKPITIQNCIDVLNLLLELIKNETMIAYVKIHAPCGMQYSIRGKEYVNTIHRYNVFLIDGYIRMQIGNAYNMNIPFDIFNLIRRF